MLFKIRSVATDSMLGAENVASLFHLVGGQLAVDPQWTPEAHAALFTHVHEEPGVGTYPLVPGFELIVEE